MPRLSPQPAGGATCLEDGMNIGDRLADILREMGWTCYPPPQATGGEGKQPVGSRGYIPFRTHDESWVNEWIDLFPALPMRIFNAMVRGGFTVDDVRVTPDGVLRKVRNIGPGSLATLRSLVPLHDAQSMSTAAARSAAPDR